MKKVLVGLSGGVDSSTTAYLLQQEGYEVEGVYLKLHHKPGYHEANIEKVENVANFLDINWHVLDLSDKFHDDVYSTFINQYEQGITPNPCVVCNRKIKFGAMLEFADEVGADFLATGHYVNTDGEFIYQAEDDTKDQSYFLFNIKKEVLPRLIFPLSKWKKSELKEFAKNLGPIKEIAEGAESAEICFVEDTYIDVLRKHVDVDNEGDVINSAGEVVGKHKGYMQYTIGKRRGFSVDGAHDPHYVTKIDPSNNRIVVGLKDELEVNKVYLEGMNMFMDESEFECDVKLRYRSSPTKCKVKIDADSAVIELEDSIFGVAPGQAAVFYDGDKVLGGGWIKSAE